MKNEYYFIKNKAYWWLLVFMLTMFGINYIVQPYIPEGYTSPKFALSYVVLAFLTAGLFFAVDWVRKMDSTKAGLAYLAASVLKMLISLVFLLPLILQKGHLAYGLAIQFMISFALLLVFEVLWMLKMLRNS